MLRFLDVCRGGRYVIPPFGQDVLAGFVLFGTK